MPNLLQALRQRAPAVEPVRHVTSVDDYLQTINQLEFAYNGITYTPNQLSGLTGTYGQVPNEDIACEFESYCQAAYAANGVVFAVMLARKLAFSAVRFQWQRINKGRPSEMFGSSSLAVLEQPWIGGTTQDLLTRVIDDADLAGNSYWIDAAQVARADQLEGVRVPGPQAELVRLRPDWVHVVLEPRMIRGGQVGWRRRGLVYFEGGPYAPTADPVAFLPDEYVHFAPIPDPLATYRGMSWLTPILREIENDKSMTRYKSSYLRNSATPNLSVSLDKDVSLAAFNAFKAAMDSGHGGPDRAGKTLYLGGGADVKVIGAGLQEMDFKHVQGAGEPLALDTPIPTPTGWTTMGDIRVGDRVLGRDGFPANVVGVSPVHAGRDCFRVTLKDRTSIVADASHLWVAVDRNTARRAERTYTTEQLFELFNAPFKNGVGGHRLSLPSTPIVALPEVDLLVDPYVLGVWLGDGQTAGAAICGAEDDLKWIAAEIERRGYTVSRWATAPGKVSVVGVPGGLLAALDAMGVLGNKQIPAAYLRASVDQRLDLLRGLMDTDGTVDHVSRGVCEFTSKLEGLARQVVELVRSLGYRATLSWKADARSRTGGTWRVFFRVEQDRIPFSLPRKVDRCEAAGYPHVSSRSIVSIEPVESVPVRCIAVDTKDNLFLAGDGFTPTHNTRIAAAGGVPPVIVGLSEGLSSATYSNYALARRRFADGTMHPLWQNVAGSFANIVPPPVSPRNNTSGTDVRLWYDSRDVPFLREDQKDAAEIQGRQASTINALIMAGFTPESAVAATSAEDWDLLHHTGLVSVQLLPPGYEKTGRPPSSDPAAEPAKPAPAKQPAPKKPATYQQ